MFSPTNDLHGKRGVARVSNVVFIDYVHFVWRSRKYIYADNLSPGHEMGALRLRTDGFWEKNRFTDLNDG